ncbi:hypothetical protein R1flu_025768 [Riccia fluitans]|uniref:AP2/ERF domain-containing protein n=1 Tax=Riccia fluitans TaxID=41844 RepID=A0ABD1XYN9_9MARC
MANDRRQAKLGLTRQPSGSIPRPPPVGGGGGGGIARQLSGDLSATTAAASSRKWSAATAAGSDSTLSGSKETGGTTTGGSAAANATTAQTTPKPSGRQRRGGPENGNHTFRGVRQRQWGRWVAEIREPRCRTRMWLGTFATALEAARAYDDAALTYHGPGARLNLPESRPKAISSTATSPVPPPTPRGTHPHPMSGLARSASCNVENYSGQDSFEMESTAVAVSPQHHQQQQRSSSIRPAHSLLRTSSSPAQCTFGAVTSDFDSPAAALLNTFVSDIRIEERASKKMFVPSQQQNSNDNNGRSYIYSQPMSSTDIHSVREPQTPAIFMNGNLERFDMGTKFLSKSVVKSEPVSDQFLYNNNCSSSSSDVIHENPFADMFGGDLGAVVGQQTSSSSLRTPEVEVPNSSSMAGEATASSSSSTVSTSSVNTVGAGVLGNCAGDEGSPTSFWTMDSHHQHHPDAGKFESCSANIADWFQMVDQQQEQVSSTSSCSNASSGLMTTSTTRLESTSMEQAEDLGPWDIGLCSPPPALDLPLGMEEPLVQFDEDFLSGQLFQERGMHDDLL